MTTMSTDVEGVNEFEAAKERLRQIVDQIDKNDLDIDKALDLYEEAVDLSVKASGSLEKAISVNDEVLDEDIHQAVESNINDAALKEDNYS